MESEKGARIDMKQAIDALLDAIVHDENDGGLLSRNTLRRASELRQAFDSRDLVKRLLATSDEYGAPARPIEEAAARIAELEAKCRGLQTGIMPQDVLPVGRAAWEEQQDREREHRARIAELEAENARLKAEVEGWKRYVLAAALAPRP